MLESKILEVRQRWCEKAVVLQTIIAEEKVFWNRNPKCDPVDRWGKRAKTTREKMLTEVEKRYREGGNNGMNSEV